MIAAVGLLSGVWAGEVGKSTPVGFTDDFATAKTEAAKANKKIVAAATGATGARNWRRTTFPNLSSLTRRRRTSFLSSSTPPKTERFFLKRRARTMPN